MKIKKSHLLILTILVGWLTYVLNSMGCPTYINYAKNRPVPFFEEQEQEKDDRDQSDNVQGEQAISLMADDNQEEEV